MSVDGDAGSAKDTQTELQMQEMEERVNVPSHGQTTKDFILDVVRCWMVQSSARRRYQEVLRTRWGDEES